MGVQLYSRHGSLVIGGGCRGMTGQHWREREVHRDKHEYYER
jgi:hypothetical protein